VLQVPLVPMEAAGGGTATHARASAPSCVTNRHKDHHKGRPLSSVTEMGLRSPRGCDVRVPRRTGLPSLSAGPPPGNQRWLGPNGARFPIPDRSGKNVRQPVPADPPVAYVE
jgi:hypothetical protein